MQGLRTIAAKCIEELKGQKATLASLKAQQGNIWCPPPKTKEVATQKVVPKINEAIEPDQFEVELVPSESLQQLSYKRIKVKIAEKDSETELVAHYFVANCPEEACKVLMTIPDKILKSFKSQKLTIAVKESNCGFWEKNITKTDIGFVGLNNANEITK